jgi:tRNA(Ile)-lysidine synthetase-like protein
MIKVKKIPNNCILACSGGVDSMSLFHYLINGRKQFSVYHFDHGTPFSFSAKTFLKEMCEKHNILLECFSFYGENANEYTWRTWRNEIMRAADKPVITAHHLEDSIESWLMRTRPMSYNIGNIYRPFIDASKKSILDYASRNGISFIEDPSNTDISFKRNKVRHVLLPLMREIGINPLNLMDKSHE